MASLSFFVGITGNIISLLLFVSPVKTFWGVVKKKSTENYKGVPYTTTLLSTSLWTFYGLIKPDILVVSVNGVGAIFQFIYVTLFLIYAPKDTKVTMAKLVAILNVGFLGVVIAVALLAIHENLRITFVGILCAALTIGMYAAPLSAMHVLDGPLIWLECYASQRRVIKTKSVEYMPFLLSFFLFLNGGVWSTYSVLVKDFYIGVPNAVGFVLGSAQLILYLMYKNKNKSASAKTMIEEDGSVQMVKGSVDILVHRNKDGEDDGGVEEGSLKNRSISKGKSLPKPSVNGEYSLQKITKTLSFSANEAGIENGKLDSP
ncbi:bidirectional sugar transporter SWEET16-like isoform X1 [Populus alba]|uniref:bidirectional sugar transporter SWEET16-like isoform X1 n=1 Tax=Populus alba TaxID=43335 RepID=UPI003CC78B84